MVNPAVSPAPGSLLRALFARKGEAAPAAPAPLQAERLAMSVRRPADPGEPQRAGMDSPLAFLIARRRAGAAMPAAEASLRRQAAALADDQRVIEVATTPRRPLTVRLRHQDFLRLRALTEARAATYQSLIEAGILSVLSGSGDPSAVPAHLPSGDVPSPKRRSLGR